MIPGYVDMSIEKALGMLPAQMGSVQARVMLYAIGLQESAFTHRAQVTNDGERGPARGLWQFERGGGVKGVMQHPLSSAHAERVCNIRGVPFSMGDVWERLETDDILAACFARLLLWTDPLALPKISDQNGAWDCYVRNWRPGRPREDHWFAHHAEAVLHVDRQQ